MAKSVMKELEEVSAWVQLLSLWSPDCKSLRPTYLPQFSSIAQILEQLYEIAGEAPAKNNLISFQCHSYSTKQKETRVHRIVQTLSQVLSPPSNTNKRTPHYLLRANAIAKRVRVRNSRPEEVGKPTTSEAGHMGPRWDTPFLARNQVICSQFQLKARLSQEDHWNSGVQNQPAKHEKPYLKKNKKQRKDKAGNCPFSSKPV